MIVQAGLALLVVAGHPPVGALPGDTEFLGDMGDGAVFDADTVNEQTPTVRVEPGVRVGHEDLQVWCEDRNLHYARRSSL